MMYSLRICIALYALLLPYYGFSKENKVIDKINGLLEELETNSEEVNKANLYGKLSELYIQEDFNLFYKYNKLQLEELNKNEGNEYDIFMNMILKCQVDITVKGINNADYIKANTPNFYQKNKKDEYEMVLTELYYTYALYYLESQYLSKSSIHLGYIHFDRLYEINSPESKSLLIKSLCLKSRLLLGMNSLKSSINVLDDIFLKIDDIEEEDSACIYLQYGINYALSNEHDSASKYLNLCYEICDNYGFKYYLSYAYHFLSVIHDFQNDNYQSSIAYEKMALELLKKINYTSFTIDIYNNLSYLSLEREEFNTANSYADSSLLLADKTGFFYYKNVTYQYKIEIAQELFPDSIEYFKLQKAIYNDSMSKLEENEPTIQEIQLKRTAREKELENQILNNKIRNYRLWFLALTGILILVIINLVLLISKRKEQNRVTYLKLEQQLLRSQMNPHFMFNSLTFIQNHIYDNNPDETAMYLASFSKLMRGILDSSRKNLVFLEDEIILIKNYLEIQKMKLVGKLEYDFAIDDKVDPSNLKIPPMFIQPFIENAIKHAMPSGDSPLQIILKITLKDENTLRLEILDNGIGISDENLKSMEQKGSYSIQITRERIKNIKKRNKYDIYFDIVKAKYPYGTQVTFEFPINKEF